MKYIKKLWLFISLITLLLTLGACSLPTTGETEPTPTEIDPVAIFTSAAATVEAQLTKTALSFSPTPEPATATPTTLPTATFLVNLNETPLATPTGATATLPPGVPTFTPGVPSLTPVPTQGGAVCDDLVLVADMTFPNGSTVESANNFHKIWRIRNTGVCSWGTGYKLVLVQGGRTLDSPDVPHEIDIVVAPGQAVDVGAKLTAPIAKGEYSSCYKMQNASGYFFGSYLCVTIVVK